MTSCRIEIKFASLESTEAVTANTGDKSFDLYEEKTWREDAIVAVEGSRGYVCRLAAWAAEEWRDTSILDAAEEQAAGMLDASPDQPFEPDERCVCGDCH